MPQPLRFGQQSEQAGGRGVRKTVGAQGVLWSAFLTDPFGPMTAGSFPKDWRAGDYLHHLTVGWVTDVLLDLTERQGQGGFDYAGVFKAWGSGTLEFSPRSLRGELPALFLILYVDDEGREGTGALWVTPEAVEVFVPHPRVWDESAAMRAVTCEAVRRVVPGEEEEDGSSNCDELGAVERYLFRQSSFPSGAEWVPYFVQLKVAGLSFSEVQALMDGGGLDMQARAIRSMQHLGETVSRCVVGKTERGDLFSAGAREEVYVRGRGLALLRELMDECPSLPPPTVEQLVPEDMRSRVEWPAEMQRPESKWCRFAEIFPGAEEPEFWF